MIKLKIIDYGAVKAKIGTFPVTSVDGRTGNVSLSDLYASKIHTHIATDITDIQATIANNADVAANTAVRHSHTNKVVLDGTEESFKSADKTNLDANTTNRHTHANKAMLDATTAAFTTTDKSNLDLNTAARHTNAYKMGVIPAATFATTGNKVITGVGFRPKYMRFGLLYTGTTAGMATGITDITTQILNIMQQTSGNQVVSASTTGYVSGYLNTAGSAFLLKVKAVSFDADGFTLNVEIASSTYSILYEAFF